jgi:hypothetical protein
VVRDTTPPTPEKQLLKLIEEPSAHAAASRPARHVRPAFSLGVLRSRFAFWRKGLRPGAGALTFDIRKVNVLLGVAVLGSGTFFVTSSTVLARRLAEPPNFSFAPSGDGAQAQLVLPTPVKALESYLQTVRARDIFRLGASPATAPSTPSQEAAVEERDSMVLSRYRLVGISWSDDPDAMIEKTDEQKTIFIKRGQQLDSLRVEAIYKDRVIVSFEGRELELR